MLCYTFVDNRNLGKLVKHIIKRHVQPFASLFSIFTGSKINQLFIECPNERRHVYKFAWGVVSSPTWGQQFDI
jgi:hypothetical protein